MQQGTATQFYQKGHWPVEGFQISAIAFRVSVVGHKKRLGLIGK